MSIVVRMHHTGRRRSQEAAAVIAQDQPGAAVGAAAGGMFVSDFEQGDIGPDLFRAACKFGLEGIVSKRRDRPYRAVRSPDWIKVKNRSHPAMERAKEAFA